MTSSLPMLLAVMLAHDLAGTLDVSDTARIYAREATIGGDVAVDIENTPGLDLALDWPTTSLALEYAPHLYWSEVVGPDPSPTLLLHTGGARLSTRDERLSITIAQTFAVGDQSFARLSSERRPLESDAPVGVMSSPELELLPGPTVLRVTEAETSASLRYDWSQRVSTELRPSLGVSGGATTASQTVLPRQRTAGIDASLDVLASRSDTLNTTVGVADASVSNGYDHLLVSWVETWSRSFALASGAALGAGVAFQETIDPADASSTQWRPIGVARAWHTLYARAMQVHLRSELGHQPRLNVLTGALQGQLYASAEAELAAGDTSLALTLGAAQTLPRDAPDAAQSLTADLVLEQALLDWLSAELGGQLTWQSLGDSNVLAASDSRWLLFAGARAELPSVRF